MTPRSLVRVTHAAAGLRLALAAGLRLALALAVGVGAGAATAACEGPIVSLGRDELAIGTLDGGDAATETADAAADAATAAASRPARTCTAAGSCGEACAFGGGWVAHGNLAQVTCQECTCNDGRFDCPDDVCP